MICTNYLFKNTTLEGGTLRYVGIYDVNGSNVDCFEPYMPGDPQAHRRLDFSVDYINKMLDEGKTTITITHRVDTKSDYMQMYRCRGKSPTMSANGGKNYLHGTDYWNYGTYDFGLFIKNKTFTIDESFRNQGFSIIFTKNVILAEITFS